MLPEKLTVHAAEDGLTLQDFIVRRLKISRRRAKTLLDERKVFVCGRRIWMARHVLGCGDHVQLALAEPTMTDPDGFSILYEDDALVVVDKPPGIEVTGPNGLESRLRLQLKQPFLCAAHRLDRDTSGCLLFARGAALLPPLIECFRRRAVCKIYDALVAGRVTFRQRTIRMQLEGLNAVTHVRRVQSGSGVTHVEVRIETGRTHQIRRHLFAVGHPVLGDRHYGAGKVCPPEFRDIPRQMLHARRLIMTHQRSNMPIDIASPLPDDFKACLKRLRLVGKKYKT